jgi:hypothetical protein
MLREPPKNWEKFPGLVKAPIDLATQLQAYLAAGQERRDGEMFHSGHKTDT